MIGSSISSSSISFIIVFIPIFISISLFQFGPSSDHTVFQTLTRNHSPLDPFPSKNLTDGNPVSRKNYIVRFFQYREAKEHRFYLESRIRSGGWEWIERRNPASKYPTDFGLVSIEDSVREKLVEEIDELELVKDVNVDASHVRGLLTEDGGRVGAFVDGKKRPGKIFTSMSFNEGGGERCTAISNAI